MSVKQIGSILDLVAVVVASQVRAGARRVWANRILELRILERVLQPTSGDSRPNRVPGLWLHG